VIRDRRPFDIVHLTHSEVPEDPRPRREAVLGVEAGYRVAVVCLADARRPTVGHHRGVAIVRLKGSKRRVSVGGYVREYLAFLLRARSLLQSDRRLGGARIVHVHTLPDFLVAAAAPAGRRGARVVLDLHEIFPEFARARFGGGLGRMAAWIARALEGWSRRQADVVITVNEPIGRLLETRAARPGERIVVIHNAPATSEFGEPAAPRPPHADGGVHLVYHGTLTPMYGVDLAVEAVARARTDGTPATLDVYGEGPALPLLMKRVVRADLRGVVRLHRPVPAARLPALLTAADAGLVPTRLDAMTRYALSTKLLELVHLGVPVLASRLPTYLEYFPEETIWYFEPNDVAAIVEAIHQLAAAPAAERLQRARAAQASGHRASWTADGARLLDLYAGLLRSGDRGPQPR
jgi:glycosyltransferase involved in cell wall biosynthesis